MNISTDEQNLLNALKMFKKIQNDPKCIDTLLSDTKEELEFNDIEFVDITKGCYNVKITFDTAENAGYAAYILKQREYKADACRLIVYVSPYL